MIKLHGILAPIAILVIVGLSALETASGQTEDRRQSPLRLVEIDYQPHASDLRVVLENTSDALITAWGIECSATDAFGASVSLGFGRDRFTSFEESLAPGESWEMTTPLNLEGNPELHTVDVIVTYAILEDGSHVGDQDEVLDVLLNRQAMLQVARAIHSDLSHATTHGDAAARLLRLQDSFIELRRGHEPELITNDLDSAVSAHGRAQVGSLLRQFDESALSVADAVADLKRQISSLENALSSAGHVLEGGGR